MPNTTNYSFPTPADTDLVKNGADAIRDLGDAVDTAMNTALGTKKAGMVLLNTTSFSAVSSQSINDVFSATYENYRIVLTAIVAASEENLSLRVRVSGADLTTSTYVYAEQSLGANGTSYNNLSTSATSIVIGRIGSAGYSSIICDIAQPFLANRTTTNSASAANGTTTSLFKGNGAGLVANTTSYTGFTIFTGSTLTGKVSVYGYNF